MNKAILTIDMPNCCGECFALDDSGDYPFCLITQEQRGYTFKIREQKMDKCPLKSVPEKRPQPQYQGNGVFGYRTAMEHEHARGWNECIDYFVNK